MIHLYFKFPGVLLLLLLLLLFYYHHVCEFFTPALAGGQWQDSKRHQVSSGLQDFSKYSHILTMLRFRSFLWSPIPPVSFLSFLGTVPSAPTLLSFIFILLIWEFFPPVSLLKTPGLFFVFWPISTLLLSLSSSSSSSFEGKALNDLKRRGCNHKAL